MGFLHYHTVWGLKDAFFTPAASKCVVSTRPNYVLLKQMWLPEATANQMILGHNLLAIREGNAPTAFHKYLTEKTSCLKHKLNSHTHTQKKNYLVLSNSTTAFQSIGLLISEDSKLKGYNWFKFFEDWKEYSLKGENLCVLFKLLRPSLIIERQREESGWGGL